MALRKITHIECGDENWTPTDEDLLNICQSFQLAQQDPVGAVVATRDGIQITHHEFDTDMPFIINGRVIDFSKEQGKVLLSEIESSGSPE